MVNRNAYNTWPPSIHTELVQTKAFKVIDNPEAFQLLADETRRRMIYLLRAKEMTVSQIAEELHLTPQAIYHQVRKLKDAGLVEVAKEERVDHFIETYYRATAEVFHMAHGVGETKDYAEGEVKEALNGLSKLGLKMKNDPDSLQKIAEIAKDIEDPMKKSELTEKATAIDDVDFFARQAVFEYIYLLSMSEKEFERYLKRYRELRESLRSLLENPSQLQPKRS